MLSTPQKINRPKAVLFDYDGVLVASEPIHLFAWMQLLSELHIPQDTPLIEQNIGKTSPEIITQLLNRYRSGWDPKEYDVHALAKRKNTFYLESALEKLQIYPGVREGILWLRSLEIPLAVVSNGKRRELEGTMRHLGIYEYMSCVISRDDVPAFKPDPTPYLYAAASLGLDPQDCLAIEDSPTGLEAALLAKVPAAGVTTNYPRKALESPIPGRPDLKPVWIGASMLEFFACLK